jgi:hypothetical protein
MNEKDLFQMALGISEPWQVAKIEFSAESHRIDLHLDFPEGSNFPCPVCGKSCSAYDTDKRSWRHLNFFEHLTYLHARLPRVKCDEHGVKTAGVPWARPGAGFTLLFEALIKRITDNKDKIFPASNRVGQNTAKHFFSQLLAGSAGILGCVKIIVRCSRIIPHNLYSPLMPVVIDPAFFLSRVAVEREYADVYGIIKPKFLPSS